MRLTMQPDVGVITLRPVRCTPPLYRQDYHATQAAKKIQGAWRKLRLWTDGYKPRPSTGCADGAFSHMHGYHPNLCKVQAAFRGYMARMELPRKRMVCWIEKLMEQ